MAKNLTVQINDQLQEKMAKLPDVNWSAVVRACLEKYCDERLHKEV